MRLALNGLGFMPGDACHDPTKWTWLPNTSTADDVWELGCWLGLNTPQVATMPTTTKPLPACAGQYVNGVCTQVAGVNDSGNTQGQLSTSGANDAAAQAQWIGQLQSGAITVGDLTQAQCSALSLYWDPTNQVCTGSVPSSGIPGWALGLIAAVVLLATGFVGGKR